MSQETSEEKSLPASARKLKKLREKGSVVTSRESVSSIAAIAALLYLYFARFSISEKMMALWELEPSAEGQDFWMLFYDKLAIVGQLGVELVLPIIALVIAVSVLTGMLVSGGPLFAVEPLTPTFDKINPVEGFKRLFNRRALLSFLMHLIRLTILSVVFGLILAGGLGVLMRAPVCGLGCAAEALQGVVQPMVIGAVAVMAAMAIFDYMVNRASFLHEQKMTKTEMKREMKDALGDPHLRSALRRDRREMLTVVTGPSKAILMVTAGPNLSVGIRYVESETPAPVVVAKARGPDAIRRMARLSRALEVREADLAEELAKLSTGSYVTEDELIVRLAPLLQQAIAARAG